MQNESVDFLYTWLLLSLDILQLETFSTLLVRSISRPFQGASLWGRFPRLKPWAKWHEDKQNLGRSIAPEGLGPKGQDSLAQGSPWVTQKNVFSPERVPGWECARSGLRTIGQSSPYGTAPSGPIRFGEPNPGEPWARR
jgi:hypothetical protein